MRDVAVVLAALLGVGCSGKIHLPVFEVSPTLKAKLRVETTVSTQVSAPPAPVPLEGADVVEFFGVPLEGVQDVVFVLDRSGSMADPAIGRIAEIAPYEYDARPEPGPAAPDAPDGPDPDAPDPDGPEPEVLEPDAPAPDEPAPDESGPGPEPDGPAVEPVPAPRPRPRKIDVARAELLAALDRLPSGTRMNVVFFNDGLEAFAPAVAALDDGSRPRLARFIRETEPRGSTALATAMRLAFVLKARRVVLLSDGLGNIGGNAGAVLRDAREAMLGGIRIDTIGLGADQDTWLLDTLARESGGLYQPL